MENLEASACERLQQGLRQVRSNPLYATRGNSEMSYSYRAIAAATVMSLAALAPLAQAEAADMAAFPVKAKPIADLPFFLVNDNRVTFAYQFTATQPGSAAKTAKQVYAFTHFDIW